MQGGTLGEFSKHSADRERPRQKGTPQKHDHEKQHDPPGESYPADWNSRVLDVRRRDNWCCQNCGRKDEHDVTLETHHITPISQGGSHAVDNLVTLCRDCHRAAEGDRLAPRYYFNAPSSLDSKRFEDLLDAVRARSEFQFDSDRVRWYLPVRNWKMIPAALQQRMLQHDVLEPAGF